MKTTIEFVISWVIILTVMYGLYWIFKTVSYEIFYEDMVRETVREMIRSEPLDK